MSTRISITHSLGLMGHLDSLQPSNSISFQSNRTCTWSIFQSKARKNTVTSYEMPRELWTKIKRFPISLKLFYQSTSFLSLVLEIMIILVKFYGLTFVWQVADFVEATVFSKDEAVVMIGNFSDSPPLREWTKVNRSLKSQMLYQLYLLYYSILHYCHLLSC